MAKIITVRKDLERRVSAGEWRPGEELPSRAVLAERYGVSPATVSIAVRDLQKKGLIRIVPSKGVYVHDPDDPDGQAGPAKANTLVGLAGESVPGREEISRRGVEAIMAQAIFDGVWQSASASNQPIVLMPAQEGKAGFDLDDCRSLGLGGLILIGANWYPQALRLRRQGFPIILGNQPAVPTPINYVDFDNAAMLRETVAVLAEAGHRRIGVICSQGTVPGYFQMLKRVFVEAVLDRGLLYDINRYWKYVNVLSTAATYPDAVAGAAEDMLAMPEPPTAVFCWTPFIASRLREAIGRRGLRVPSDVSVICSGYIREDEADVSGFLPPHFELGQSLLEHLLATIRDPFYCVQSLIALKYLDRGTVAPPPAQHM